MKKTGCTAKKITEKNHYVFLAMYGAHQLVHAEIDRAGNVLSDGGDSSITGPAIFFIVLSFLVLHLGGESALFKMWGFLLAAAIGIGLLKGML
jgi:hypothetical protein